MKIVKKIQSRFFPSKLELMARRWERDGGDYRFRFDYKLGEQSTVIDLGGYEGQWASDIYGRFNCTVHIFEPVEHYADKIKERFSRNHKISVHPFALGGHDHELEIYVSGPSSSVYLKGNKKERITVIDVASWIEKANLMDIDVMKINIEGGEYELLDRIIETGIVERVRDIQIQFHRIDGDSEKHMKAIQSQLAQTHKLTYAYEFIWENWTRLK